MDAILGMSARILIYLFILANLFGTGLGLTLKEIFEPVKEAPYVIKALVINFVLVPFAAFFLAVALGADGILMAGIMIVACCAGEGFLPKLIRMVKGDLARSISFMALAMLSTVIISPFLVPYVIPGLTVSAFSIAQHLVFLMLIPLSLGLALRAAKPSVALAIEPMVLKFSSACLLVAVIPIIVVEYRLIVSAYGTGIYRLALAFTLLNLAIGYLFGGPGKRDRIVQAFGAGARNIAAALLIAGSFSDPKVMTEVLIIGLVMFVVLILSAQLYGKYQKA